MKARRKTKKGNWNSLYQYNETDPTPLNRPLYQPLAHNLWKQSVKNKTTKEEYNLFKIKRNWWADTVTEPKLSFFWHYIFLLDFLNVFPPPPELAKLREITLYVPAQQKDRERDSFHDTFLTKLSARNQPYRRGSLLSFTNMLNNRQPPRPLPNLYSNIS